MASVQDPDPFAPDPDAEAELQPAPPAPLGGLRRRGIYLLPNLFTTGVLFAGFYGMVQAVNGVYDAAAIAVLIAMLLDGMDGRVARWTHTSSEFGAQYDSIADMVAFGAAPAFITYIWALQDLGKLGWIAAFVHLAGAGIRLARFNVNIGVVDKRYFQGLPSPSGAAVLAGLVWMMSDLGFDPQESFRIAGVPWLAGVAWVMALFSGITMVLNVPFYSFKEFNWKRRVPLWVILAAVIALSVIATRPSVVLYLLIMAYALSGYAMWAMGQRVRSVLPEE
jgi:CDP-diacylglycerol---serine O-phosphatidyltransferase